MSHKKLQATKVCPCAAAPGGDTDQAAAVVTRGTLLMPQRPRLEEKGYC